MNLTAYTILLPVDELSEKLEKQIRRIAKKRGLLQETAFILGITFLNFDYLTQVKILLNDHEVNFTIAYAKRMIECQSCLPIKVVENTASIRNLNYIKTKPANS